MTGYTCMYVLQLNIQFVNTLLAALRAHVTNETKCNQPKGAAWLAKLRMAVMPTVCHRAWCPSLAFACSCRCWPEVNLLDQNHQSLMGKPVGYLG